MTDTEPAVQTEAGKALLADLRAQGVATVDDAARIVAIEQEARAIAGTDRVAALEKAARQAFASDGIAAAQRVWPKGVAFVAGIVTDAALTPDEPTHD